MSVIRIFLHQEERHQSYLHVDNFIWQIYDIVFKSASLLNVIMIIVLELGNNFHLGIRPSLIHDS